MSDQLMCDGGHSRSAMDAFHNASDRCQIDESLILMFHSGFSIFFLFLLERDPKSKKISAGS